MTSHPTEPAAALDVATIQRSLPQPEPTSFPYEPITLDGTTAYLAGQVAKQNGVLAHTGTVGRDISLPDAVQSARICAEQALAWLNASAGGLGNLRRILRITCYVAHSDDFDAISTVANGASDYLIETLGDKGRHARSVIGVKRLPRNASVLLEVTASLNRDTADMQST